MENFNELDLSPALTRAIKDVGYEKPTPIQVETLPLLLAGPTDFLGLAATGTGKTAAYGIPLLEKLDKSIVGVQGLILCPTRELALQVTEQLNLLGKHKGVRAIPIYGGAGYSEQIRGLRAGASIVVATPGRLIDHIEKGTVELANVTTVILDEADEMISMGFKDELELILESMPGGHNTWLFSATMSKDVRKVADRFLTTPKTVQINKTEMLSGTVRQIYYTMKESNKPDILCKLIDAADDFYGLIFCQTKSLVMDLTTLLISRGYKVDCLHGDKDQNARERTMRAFRDRRVNILVCTDVASRGLDVKDLTHVINYSIPRELDNYVHRIGRTGRSGKLGLALSLVTPSHMALVGKIEKMTKSKMEVGAIPSRKDIGAKKVAKVLETFLSVENHSRVEELLDDAWTTALEGMTKVEIASRLLVLSYPDIFVDQDKATTAQLPGKPEFESFGRDERRGGGDRGGFRREGRRDRDDRGGDRGERPAFRRPAGPMPTVRSNDDASPAPAAVSAPREFKREFRGEARPDVRAASSEPRVVVRAPARRGARPAYRSDDRRSERPAFRRDERSAVGGRGTERRGERSRTSESRGGGDAFPKPKRYSERKRDLTIKPPRQRY